jgi:hypothetical protein
VIGKAIQDSMLSFQRQMDAMILGGSNIELSPPSVLTYSTFIFNTFNAMPEAVRYRLRYIVNAKIPAGRFIEVPVNNGLNITGQPEIHARGEELAELCRHLDVEPSATILSAYNTYSEQAAH